MYASKQATEYKTIPLRSQVRESDMEVTNKWQRQTIILKDMIEYDRSLCSLFSVNSIKYIWHIDSKLSISVGPRSQKIEYVHDKQEWLYHAIVCCCFLILLGSNLILLVFLYYQPGLIVFLTIWFSQNLHCFLDCNINDS